MKKSVVFIEPVGGITNVFENYMRLPLLGTPYLGTILSQAGHDVRILNENVMGHKVDPFTTHADVYCITALTVSCKRAQELAREFKRLYPESKVMIGGIHASLIHSEFEDLVDHVVIGEAEDLIVDLIEGRIKERIVHGKPVADMNALPMIDYSLLEGRESMDIIPVMTSRGCPFDCNFCTVTKIFGRGFRMFSAERIVEEVEHACQFFPQHDFFFYDDNFTANRKRVSKFCDLVAERGLKITWTAQVRSDLARDEELVAKMVEAGCRTLYIGFESIDDETLKALHKGQTRADIETAIRVFHAYGLHIHGMFIFGEDHDNTAKMQSTVDFAIENNIDTVQFMILTPFPGTQIHAQLEAEGRLLHNDWDYYNGMFAVFEPKHMSATTLQAETFRAYQRFYSLSRTLSDAASLTVDLVMDAMVWNFGRAHRYRLDTLVLRGAAQAIVSRASGLSKSYLDFLEDCTARREAG